MQAPDGDDSYKTSSKVPESRFSASTMLSVALAALILLAIGGGIWQIWGPRPPSQPIVTVDEPPPAPPTFTLTFTPMPSSTPGPTHTPTPIPTATPSPTPTPILIDIHELGYLTTIQYTARTVVREEITRPWPLISEWVLLEAVGNVQVGISMTQVTDSDAQIQGTSIRVELPHAEVTSVELLPGESKVHDRKTVVILSEYEGLELKALENARVQLREWVSTNPSLLGLAERVGRLQLEDFLRSLGFQDIQITFKD